MKLKLQVVTTESLSSARAQRMNRNTAGTFSNILEKVATGTNLSETRGIFFNIDENGVQINNKPGSVITEKGSKHGHVLTSTEKS